MYEVLFRAEVVLEDEHKLLRREQQRHLLERLENNPTSEKPLTHALRGCFRCRVGDLRVVFTVDEQAETVTIIAIGRRRDDEVYKLAAKRA